MAETDLRGARLTVSGALSFPPKVAESQRDRDGHGYSSELRFYGVFCRETGDMIYYETGNEMFIDRGGRKNSGATDVYIKVRTPDPGKQL